MRRLAGAEEEQTPTSSCGNIRFCAYCPRRKNKKSKKSCRKCKKTVCNEHCYLLCVSCAEELFD